MEDDESLSWKAVRNEDDGRIGKDLCQDGQSHDALAESDFELEVLGLNRDGEEDETDELVNYCYS